jgi:hyperosmotically inducible periplasmic protein
MTLVLILGNALMLLNAQNQPAASDNTKQNKAGGATAESQKEDKTDRAISQKIRKAIVSDKSLSTYAHNIKIITTHGLVVLKGPVRSEDEKSAIEAKAGEVAAGAHITSKLTVVPKNNSKK